MKIEMDTWYTGSGDLANAVAASLAAGNNLRAQEVRIGFESALADTSPWYDPGKLAWDSHNAYRFRIGDGEPEFDPEVLAASRNFYRLMETHIEAGFHREEAFALVRDLINSPGQDI